MQISAHSIHARRIRHWACGCRRVERLQEASSLRRRSRSVGPARDPVDSSTQLAAEREPIRRLARLRSHASNTVSLWQAPSRGAPQAPAFRYKGSSRARAPTELGKVALAQQVDALA